MSTEPQIIVIRETVLEAWAKDAGMFVLFAGLIGLGTYIESTAMQWAAFLICILVLVNRASGRVKRMTKAEAIKFINEMKA